MSEHAFLSVNCKDRTKVNASSFDQVNYWMSRMQGESALSLLVKEPL